MAIANLALRFLLELAGFAGAGFAVYELADGAAGFPRWVLAVVASLVVIGLWAAVVAPRTRNGLSQAQKDVIGTTILLLIAVPLALAGQPGLAIGLGMAVILNAVLLFVFGQDVRERFESRPPG